MNPRLVAKLDRLIDRRAEVEAELAAPGATADPDAFRRLSQEYAALGAVTETASAQRAIEAELRGLEEMARDTDPELRAMASAERPALLARLEALETDLSRHLAPKDPFDEHSLFLEIRAGTGGDEAAIFAGDLYRMYARYIESAGWALEVLSESPGEHGGYREIITRVNGYGAYGKLKFESGAHRVQRVPETEAQGRIHTSAATVAVLPEIPENEITINPADLRVDTFRASGAGGQHVNKTDSAIRITHLPTNTVVECDDERSQHKNRARAMSLLAARLADAERERHQKATADARRKLVGSGDRSERIRTYNFPQGRLTDHRINLTLYQLDRIVAGDLEPVIGPLTTEHQADLLAADAG